MFTHLLNNSDKIFAVEFSDYSKRHFLKRFEKSYKGKQWAVTYDSIIQDLSRIRTSVSDLQYRQQVDELYHKDNFWIFKYDFRIAGTNESTKTSGNRCVVFIDENCNKMEILLIYGKIDLPKNITETQYINNVLKHEFHQYLVKC